MTKDDFLYKSASRADCIDWNEEIPGFESPMVEEQEDNTVSTESTDDDDGNFENIIALHMLEEGQAQAERHPPRAPLREIEVQEQPSSSAQEPPIAKTLPLSRLGTLHFLVALSAAAATFTLMQHMHTKLTEKD